MSCRRYGFCPIEAACPYRQVTRQGADMLFTSLPDLLTILRYPLQPDVLPGLPLTGWF